MVWDVLIDPTTFDKSQSAVLDHVNIIATTCLLYLLAGEMFGNTQMVCELVFLSYYNIFVNFIFMSLGIMYYLATLPATNNVWYDVTAFHKLSLSTKNTDVITYFNYSFTMTCLKMLIHNFWWKLILLISFFFQDLFFTLYLSIAFSALCYRVISLQSPSTEIDKHEV